MTDRDGNTICVATSDRGPANASQIAAAPDLLARLVDLVETAPLTHGRLTQISAALFRATGENGD